MDSQPSFCNWARHVETHLSETDAFFAIVEMDGQQYPSSFALSARAKRTSFFECESNWLSHTKFIILMDIISPWKGLRPDREVIQVEPREIKLLSESGRSHFIRFLFSVNARMWLRLSPVFKKVAQKPQNIIHCRYPPRQEYADQHHQAEENQVHHSTSSFIAQTAMRRACAETLLLVLYPTSLNRLSLNRLPVALWLTLGGLGQ